MHDILIKNGTIIDGTGNKKYESDVAINDGVITEIGDMSGDGAHEVIDAHGLVVTPGFIDISNRSDTRWRLFKDPGLESMLYQGVTTIIGGNSGTSLAPIYNEDMLKSSRKWTDIGSVNVDWQSVSDFLDVVDNHKLSVNFGTFVGYGTLRRGLIGDENRELTENEKVSIEKHITESLKHGALGVSTGMIYSHERDIKMEELIDVAKIVAKNKKIFVAHLRNEGENLLKSIEEIINIKKESGAKMHVSHLKATKKDNWSDMKIAIEMLENEGIVFDIYPYTFSVTVLYTLLPDWISDGGRRMLLERLRNKKLRERVVSEMENGIDLSNAVVAHTLRSDYFCGKTFRKIAKTQNSSIPNAVIDVLLASDGQVNIFLESVSPENIKRGINSESSVISTNGVGYTIEKRNYGLEHPRSFGAFPKIFDDFMDDELNAETIVYKSTGKIVDELGIDGRGLIKEGYIADINIFSIEDFEDNATIENPYQYATGLQNMIINGQVVIKYGKYNGVRAGKVIKG
ncbi:MAG: N-acyl-D-amino-acid deacylase family protein [Candidatus Moraniibacteriota bacterium]|jgi:N-acyl-D-amino-acid deacylase